MFKLILIALIGVSCMAQNINPSIFYVSMSAASQVSPAYSSLRGGTSIYIKAIGHDSVVASNNLIFIGAFPCIIPSDGVTSTFISCVTTDSGSSSDINNLPVTLLVNQKSFTTVYPNVVNYQNSYTPYVYEIFPAAGYANSWINISGIHRISDLGDGLRNMGDIVKLKLGNDICNRFDLVQSDISPTTVQIISCIESSLQQAGKYNFTELLTPGLAINDPGMRRSSLVKGDYFEFTALPTISSIAPSQGNLGGQYLVIGGTGFSANTNNISVTVDNNVCTVTKSSENQISCTLSPRNSTLSSKLQTNSTNQLNGYFSGAGLNYSRYSVPWPINITVFTQAVRQNNPSILKSTQQTSIKAELREGDFYGTWYGQVWTGYFTAPTSANYTFRGIGDDQFAFYISSTYGSTEPSSTPLIYSYVPQTYGDFYANYVNTAEGSVALQAGLSYYIEAYHVQFNYVGFFSLQVDVASSDTSLPSQAYQVATITTNTTIQPEVVVYSMVGGSSGSINLKIVRKNSAQAITYNVNVTVAYGCSAATFLAALNSFNSFSPYNTQVVRKVYDSQQNLVNTQDTPPSTASRIDYVVSIYILRPSAYQSQKFILTYVGYQGIFIMNPSTSPSSPTQHSNLMGGTWGLSIDFITVALVTSGSSHLYYNIDATSLENSIRKIPGYEQVQVTLYSPNNLGCGYSCVWTITFVGVTKSPIIRVDPTGLTGGSSSPTVSVNILRPYSTSITFVVDYNFVHTYTNNINVLVTVNKIPSVCLTNCSYTFIDATKITALSLTGSTINFAISNPKSLSFTYSDITVTANGMPCTVSQGPLSGLSCSLQTNNDSSPILVAGQLTPIFYVNPYGIAILDNGVSPITVPLIAQSLSVSTGGSNGGFLTTITGSGFSSDTSQIQITLCGNVATISSSNNQQIILYVPSCGFLGPATVNIRVGSVLNSNLTFTYVDSSLTAPLISSISPTSANPAKKAVLNISGSRFGTNITQLKVFLSNSSGKVYQLSILNISDTLLTVGLSGGLAGDFLVQVNTLSKGDSIASVQGANKFSYKCTISSIWPKSGSYNGGTLLTIVGQNFSSSSGDTLVYVGGALDWQCSIQSINSTVILCRTPAISPSYRPGDPQTIVISTNLVVYSQCLNNCDFTYLNSSSSPYLATLSPTKVAAQTITLTGTNFTNKGAFSSCTVSLTNTDSGVVTVLTTISCNDTNAQAAISNTQVSGNYQVKLRNDIGESNGISLVVNWVLGNGNYTKGGSTAGSIVSFTGGSGYPASISGLFSIVISSQNALYPVNILSCCTANSLTLQIPAAVNGTVIAIYFTSPTNLTNPQNKTYISNTSLTPTLAIKSPKVISTGFSTINVTVTSSLVCNIISVSLVSIFDKSIVVNVTSWTSSLPTISFNATLNSGSYRIRILSNYGFYQCTDLLNVTAPTLSGGSSQVASFAGSSFTITAAGLSSSSYITVNGLVGNIISYSATAVTYQIPALVTTDSNSVFNLASVARIDLRRATFFSDQDASVSNVTAAFDGLINTIYGSTNTDCWIGIDIGTGLNAYINRIRFFPYLAWSNTANYTLYAQFQGSNDRTTWTTLAIIDQTVHSGYNTIMTISSNSFRYIRFKHNSTSQCNLAQLQLYGIVYSNIVESLTSQLSDVLYIDGFNNQTISNAIQYRSDHTPVVSSVNPIYGDIFGGYSLTITGQNLGFDVPSVIIDGVACTNATSTATTIVCTVGARPNLPKSNSFVVTIGNQQSIIQNSFLYVLKWSDKRTWGVSLPPVDGDLVYIPQGMTLLVDQSTPILAGIAAQNATIIFSNDTDLVVQAGFITVVGGSFLAGTEANPYQRQLTFILYGNYYGSQQPMFGNKGIGCLECKFSMYGTPRNPTWTTIAATIQPNDISFTVSQDVDWKVGEQIVIASTSFIHTQAQQRTISAISGRTITVDSPFAYKHVSVIENYGTSDQLVMQAEVGLLTRNIKVMGDDSSVIGKYGSHLILTGKAVNGLEGHIAYTEFYHCGQPQILGRYCIHFHMNGEVPTSYVRGNSVHESYARVITIHGVHFLIVELNVGYRVAGHNYFIEDGIETKNVLRYNLAISSLTVTSMLQTDISVASFWVTNPSNDFYGNHAAGGDFYGIWYEIKQHPDGPSATNDVCPMGNPLGKVYNNTAHSNIRFGFRVFTLVSRLYPCKPVRNDSNADDPWAFNPSITSTFQNFTVYKNLQDGVLLEATGNIIINNFVIAQNYHAGLQFYVANFTKQPVVLTNSVIIGQSKTNAAANTKNYSLAMSAVITPRTGQSNFSNIRFYNYPSGSVALTICSKCDSHLSFTNVGTEVFTNTLSFTNITGNYIKLLGLRRDMIYDQDGSLVVAYDSNKLKSATVVNNFPHIALYQSNCKSTNTPIWDNAVICNENATVRRVMFTNLANTATFKGQTMKAIYLSNASQLIDPNTNSSWYTSIISYMPGAGREAMIEKPFAWSLPFITGNTYGIWWGSGLDFTNMAVSSTSLFSSEDKGIVFKFNYTLNRETYYVGPIVGGKPLTALNYVKQYVAPGNKSLSSYNPYLDVNVCNNGDWYHNNDTSPLRMFTICQSGKNKHLFEYTQANAVVCSLYCNSTISTVPKETTQRVWSNASNWPNGYVPKAGENVTIPASWTIILDVDPAPAAYLIIDGAVIADDSRDVNITAKAIFIRQGSLNAGSPGNPFTHKLTIQINGNKQDYGYYIDPVIAGNKFFVVTGSLNLYGVTPNTVMTYLTKSAMKGSSIIYVGSSDGWKVGDQIALAPSFSNPYQYETAKITSINLDGSIVLNQTLNYTHYGSSSITISNSYGSLDSRSSVGHLNRNITIVSGPDSGWGFNIIVYSLLYGNTTLIGSVNLVGVQLLNGGQYDTENSALVFLNTDKSQLPSIISNTTFVNCKAYCININGANNLTITNNVFYNGWVFGLRALSLKMFTFTYNLLIGIIQRPTMGVNTELVACVAFWQYIDPSKDNIQIQNNICQGSDGHGFAFPHILCSQIDSHSLGNNTAGSCYIGFIFSKAPGTCQAFSWISAYACTIAQMSSPPNTDTLIFSNFILADNQRGITLRFGNGEGNSNNTAYVYNSYITAVSRPDCTYCYGSSATDCSGNTAVRMLTAAGNGEVLPRKFGKTFDIVCKNELFDSKSYLYNVIFDSFSQSYSQNGLSSCGNNFIFTTSPQAFDYLGSSNLFNCSCNNCDYNSYVYCDPNLPNQLGWMGGCGDIMCTGKQNYLVRDFNGTFFPFKGLVIPNNPTIGNNEANCTYNPTMNGHLCQRFDFGVLKYQSIAFDKSSRIMWPVNLTYEGSKYVTTTNGFREWNWLGGQPQNSRLGRFISIIKYGSTYNLSFAASPPIDMQFQLERSTPLGNKSNYVIIKMAYPLPNTIRSQVNGVNMQPAIQTDSGLSRALNTSLCGDSVYFYTNYSINFVVTQQPTCLVRISLADNIQLTTHFSMDASKFFTNNIKSKFISNLCALLRISDTSRVVIVGVRTGSVIIVASILPDPAAPVVANGDPTLSQTSSLVTSMINDGSLATGLSSGVGSDVLGVSSTLYTLSSSDQQSSSSSSSSSTKFGLLIGVVIGGVALLTIAVVLLFYCLRKRAKIFEQIQYNEEFFQNEKNMQKPQDRLERSSEFQNDSLVSNFKINQHQDTPNINQLEEVCQQ